MDVYLSPMGFKPIGLFYYPREQRKIRCGAYHNLSILSSAKEYVSRETFLLSSYLSNDTPSFAA